MILVDRPRRPGPLEERPGIERHHLSVTGPFDHIGDQTVSVQLRIALPARAMDEASHHPTLRGHPATHPARLLAGYRRPLFQKPHGLGHRLPVGGADHLRHRLRPQRPQQRHALRRRERHIERPHRTGPTRQQRLTRHRVKAVNQPAQLVGLHHPRQTQLLRPRAGPHPRRLTHPRVILVDIQRHRRNQILPIRQPRHRQHPQPPPSPSITKSRSANRHHHGNHQPHNPNNPNRHRHLPPSGGHPQRGAHDDPPPRPNSSCPGRGRERGEGGTSPSSTTVSPGSRPST